MGWLQSIWSWLKWVAVYLNRYLVLDITNESESCLMKWNEKNEMKLQLMTLSLQGRLKVKIKINKILKMNENEWKEAIFHLFLFLMPLPLTPARPCIRWLYPGLDGINYWKSNLTVKWYYMAKYMVMGAYKVV